MITLLLNKLLSFSQQQDYRGFNKHDGLLSPALNVLLGWSRLGRLVAIQSIMRSPFNIRPLVGVPKTRNPKGIGLFAHSLIDAAILQDNIVHRQEAEELLSWLLDHANRDYDGLSWGYQYPWQDVGFFAPVGLSNRVVTCWIGFAFFRAYELTQELEYLETCKKICRFLLEAPNRIIDSKNQLCLSYVPDHNVTWAVMDVSALCAKMLVLTGTASSDSSLLADAGRCMNYIIDRQTDYHAWYYTDPPKDSHITHDNYHTGIILDCILDYMAAVEDQRLEQNYLNGLEYYRQHLFLENGAPKWMNNKNFPHDIHGAAQGIISFSKASAVKSSYLEEAEKILSWTLEHLYDRQVGTFWYQKTKHFTKKFTLLRWCNGWMARALTEYLLAQKRLQCS